MKLRIKGNSMRLRISPSEMMQLLESGRIEETIHFGPEEGANLTYGVEIVPLAGAMTLQRYDQRLTVVISRQQVQGWAGNEQVGLYGEVDAGGGRLELAVEKDFACLDRDEGENLDTYPNPKPGTAC